MPPIVVGRRGSTAIFSPRKVNRILEIRNCNKITVCRPRSGGAAVIAAGWNRRCVPAVGRERALI